MRPGRAAHRRAAWTGCRAWPAGRARSTELPGGLTNRNYKVTTPDGSFVARTWAGGGDLLAINRDHEYRNSVIAARGRRRRAR